MPGKNKLANYNITNPFFAKVYNSIRLNSVKSGYTSILFTIEDDLKTLESYMGRISKHQVDVLILCFVDENELIETYADQIQPAIPVILFELSFEIQQIKIM